MKMKARTGFGFLPGAATDAIDLIKKAEAAGVDTIWTIMPALGRDTLTLYAAAAVQTERIRLGTAIVPAFTRHPWAMATQMLTLEDLTPGRFRLGIGTSHQRTMIPAFGTDFSHPLQHLREYVEVLRTVLQTGSIDHKGEYYTANGSLPRATGTPVLISALRENAFELAGELTDGAISWLCPVDYLATVAQPAMQRGADRAGRAKPPLIAHVLVAPSEDRDAVRASGKRLLEMYAGAVFYQRMFAASGFPLGPNGDVADGLVDALVVYGSEAEIREQLERRFAMGMDELLLSIVPVADQRADEERLLDLMSRLT